MMKAKPPTKEKTAISLVLHRETLKKIDEFVEEGIFMNRSDFIRAAIRHYVRYLSSPTENTGGRH